MSDGKGPSAALAKLQAAAGVAATVMDKPSVERLDWMYEQSAASTKPSEEELMNTPVAAQKDQDVEDVKKLQDSTAGSLFLRSATKTTEDMLRKLREDPLFQIRRQEQAARESMMSNPLIRQRLEHKAQKQAKKMMKKVKKAAKKEKKKAKKEKKKMKKAEKAAKGGGSSSSSSSSSSDAGPAGAPAVAMPVEAPSAELGPSGHMVSKREEYAATLAARKEAALASRGAPRRMDEDEKRRRLQDMQDNAARHERYKDQRIASAEQRERAQAEKEEAMRKNNDQQYFKDMRRDAYMDSGATMADRLKNQRHRRQKNLNDPLERDG